MTDTISPDYQPRINLLRSKIAEFLAFYTPPQDVDEGRLINQIAEIMNKQFSAPLDVNVMAVQIDEALQILMSEYKQTTWPRPAHFVDACKQRQRRAAERTLKDDGSTAYDRLSADDRKKADEVIAIAQRWLESTSPTLREHARKTLEHWGVTTNDRERRAMQDADLDWLAFNATDRDIRDGCQRLSDAYLDHDQGWWDEQGKPDESMRARIKRGDTAQPDRDGVMALISAQGIQ